MHARRREKLRKLGNDFCNCCHSFGSLVYAISGQCYLSMLACTPTSVEARNSLSSEILRVGSVSSMRSWYFGATLSGALSFSWKHSISGPHKNLRSFLRTDQSRFEISGNGSFRLRTPNPTSSGLARSG